MASRRAIAVSRKADLATPKARPKGSKNLATLVAQALDEKVMVTEDGRPPTRRSSTLCRALAPSDRG